MSLDNSKILKASTPETDQQLLTATVIVITTTSGAMMVVAARNLANFLHFPLIVRETNSAVTARGSP